MSTHGVETDGRLNRERAFHDQAYAGGADSYRPETSKFYSIGRRRREYYESLFAVRARGAKALEYGCGLGDRAIFLARKGASVTAIDLSPVAIERAGETAEREGLTNRIDFRVMDAEHLDFPDESFDLITGAGILHHLELGRCLPELARVMKSDGVAAFGEPLGHNPFLNLYRNRSSDLRTEDEHPLVMADIELMKEHFGRVRTRFFSLTSVPAFVFRKAPGFELLVAGLDALDRLLFRVFPPLRRYAWFVIMELSEPRRDATAPPHHPR